VDGHAISFGSFRLLAAQRLLLEGGKPVRLGSRAFEILAALVERAGQVVGKEELIARAWPQTFVEESNLKIQVSALRRAIGDGQDGRRYVVTVPGRGYNFVAPVSLEEPPLASLPPMIAPAGVHNLPLAMTRMIGREEVVATLVSRLSRERLLTIVGPGGIGKTTLALAVAERMIESYEQGVWLVDLAPLGDPRLVPSAVATVLGLEIHTEDPLVGLVAGLRDKRMLLLLDNCEHVIDAAASLAAAVLIGVPRVNILATSREPLRVAGEREHHLGPLDSPPTSSGLTAAEAAAFPAVQLFVERVTAIVEDFALTDANAAPVVEICQRLDGLPLAIELAAPRVEVLGVGGLAARLDHSLPLLGPRRRATTARHQTMRAVVDWSYGLLSEDEQRFFRALGIFAGGFTVEAAAAVALDPATTRIDAIDRLADLVAKSLLAADIGGTEPRFRLLETTRAYALERLAESGELEIVARRHAEYYRGRLERAEAEWETRPTLPWLGEYAAEIDNLRAALDWAFSPDGDASTGAALTAAAIPLWTHLSLIEECHARVERALAVETAGAQQDERRLMKLQAAVGTALILLKGAAAPETGAAWTDVIEIAGRLGDAEYQLRALWALWMVGVNTGQYRSSLQLAERFCSVAAQQADPNDRLIGERMTGAAQYFLGDLRSAGQRLERFLAEYVSPNHRSHIIRFQFDPRVPVRVLLAWILWLQGFPDRGRRTAEGSVEEARAANHAGSMCYALALGACPLALLFGDLTAAEQHVNMLVEHSTRHGLTLWRALGRSEQGVLATIRGDNKSGPALLRSILGEVPDAGFALQIVTFLGLWAAVFGRADRIEEELAHIVASTVRSNQAGEGWLIAELLRLKGELLLLQGASGAAMTAEQLFRRSLEQARRQGALAWELRAATSLARLQRDQGRSADAVAVLNPVYDRFTEGFGTADLVAAKQLLEDLGSARRD
jgi:predicted ATPase/DNA-binding winged helix-turn-helix (wHTH) protein